MGSKETMQSLEVLPLPKHELRDTLSTFVGHLKEFGFDGESLGRFEQEFDECFLATKRLNQGEIVPGVDLHFEKNGLRYHNWEHTANVVEKTFQIIPGFLHQLA